MSDKHPPDPPDARDESPHAPPVRSASFSPQRPGVSPGPSPQSYRAGRPIDPRRIKSRAERTRHVAELCATGQWNAAARCALSQAWRLPLPQLVAIFDAAVAYERARRQLRMRMQPVVDGKRYDPSKVASIVDGANVTITSWCMGPVDAEDP